MNKTTADAHRAAYERALAEELRIVGTLPERANPAQLSRASAAARRTNAALRALQAAPDYA